MDSIFQSRLVVPRLTERLSRVVMENFPGSRNATSLSSRKTTWSVCWARAEASDAASEAFSPMPRMMGLPRRATTMESG